MTVTPEVFLGFRGTDFSLWSGAGNRRLKSVPLESRILFIQTGHSGILNARRHLGQEVRK